MAKREGIARYAAPSTNRPRIVVEELADFNESINIMIYGDSGAGKTVLSSFAPDAVILSTEKGTLSARRMGSNAKLIRVYDWESVEAALDYLEKHARTFQWVILDSLTKMQVLMLRWILRSVVAQDSTRDPDIPAIADHQKWQNMFKRFVDRIIDMQINVIFTATAMHKEDAEGDDLVLPDLQGKDYAISQYVCAQMDSVFYYGVGKARKGAEPPRRLLTQGVAPFFAKDRYNSMPRWVDDPHIEDVIAAIENSTDFQSGSRNGAAPVPTFSTRRRNLTEERVNQADWNIDGFGDSDDFTDEYDADEELELETR